MTIDAKVALKVRKFLFTVLDDGDISTQDKLEAAALLIESGDNLQLTNEQEKRILAL